MSCREVFPGLQVLLFQIISQQQKKEDHVLLLIVKAGLDCQEIDVDFCYQIPENPAGGRLLPAGLIHENSHSSI